MLKIFRHSKFKTDSRRIIRSGHFNQKDEKRLLDAIECLAKGEKLDESYKDHPLSGNWREYRECHIKPDLLLIYLIKEDTLKLIRLGSHSELF